MHYNMIYVRMQPRDHKKGHYVMNLEQIRAALRDRVTNKVAEETGIHPHTIRAIKNGQNQNPTYRTVQALAQYLGSDISA